MAFKHSLTFFTLFCFIGGWSASSVAQVTKTKRIKATTTRKKYTQIHLGYQMWQESIDATSAGVSSEIRTHFHGFRLGYSKNRPHKNVRWVSVYGVDVGLGIAKGVAALPLTDEVRDQPWLSLTVYPGWMYRSTSKSEFGILIPVVYRHTLWELQPPFEIDRQSSFSAGITGVYLTRLNPKSSMTVTLTHQQLWDATAFGIGYQIDFR